MPSITNLLTNLITKINEVKNKIPGKTNLSTTTTALTTVENKTGYYSKYITTPQFNKLTNETLTGRLKPVNLATKGYIADFVKKDRFQ